MLARLASKGKIGSVRNPERTRQALLEAAFREIYRSGFQSASLDNILASAGVTKGALYHHFDSKESLGYAIADEVVAGFVRDKWLLPLHSSVDPIETLVGIVQGTSVRYEDVRGGCPLNNLSQEMSPLDEKFRRRLAKVFGEWQEAIAAALSRGQSDGTVRRDLDTREAADFLIAIYEGYLSLAKNAQDPGILIEGIRNIVKWLRSLRAANRRK